MKRYLFKENNSGGFTVYMDCDIEDSGRPKAIAVMADNVFDAIDKFCEHAGIDWEKQNSYEENSCNCCGRRFEVYALEDEDSDDVPFLDYVDIYEKGEYPDENVVNLRDAPTTLKKGHTNE